MIDLVGHGVWGTGSESASIIAGQSKGDIPEHHFTERSRQAFVSQNYERNCEFV
jgi:hypothetical protein